MVARWAIERTGRVCDGGWSGSNIDATRRVQEMRQFRFRNLHKALAAAAGALGVLLLIAAPTAASAQGVGKPMTTASGLQIIDTVVGTGPSPKPGQICVMHYTGWLDENGKKGKKFD